MNYLEKLMTYVKENIPAGNFNSIDECKYALEQVHAPATIINLFEESREFKAVCGLMDSDNAEYKIFDVYCSIISDTVENDTINLLDIINYTISTELASPVKPLFGPIKLLEICAELELSTYTVRKSLVKKF